MQLGILREHNVNEIHNVQGFYDCTFKAFLQKGQLISAMAAVIVLLQSRFNVCIKNSSYIYTHPKKQRQIFTFREKFVSFC